MLIETVNYLIKHTLWIVQNRVILLMGEINELLNINTPGLVDFANDNLPSPWPKQPLDLLIFSNGIYGIKLICFIIINNFI